MLGLLIRLSGALVVAVSLGGAAPAVGRVAEPATSASVHLGSTTGAPVPGGYLSVDLGSLAALSPAAYDISWLRDGVTIREAGSRDYLVQPADVGHLVAPSVTTRGLGTTTEGTAVAVRALASTTTIALRRIRPPNLITGLITGPITGPLTGPTGGTGRVWAVVATVRSERPWPVTGSVHVLAGRGERVLGEGHLGRDVAVVSLPLRAGERGLIRVRACYPGSEAVAASCSSVAVRRR